MASLLLGAGTMVVRRHPPVAPAGVSYKRGSRWP
ncbi:MAG: hypothetical protein ACYTFA_01190 [Planctomycetota bacterium]